MLTLEEKELSEPLLLVLEEPGDLGQSSCHRVTHRGKAEEDGFLSRVLGRSLTVANSQAISKFWIAVLRWPSCGLTSGKTLRPF
jgi:hypothetical protein